MGFGLVVHIVFPFLFVDHWRCFLNYMHLSFVVSGAHLYQLDEICKMVVLRVDCGWHGFRRVLYQGDLGGWGLRGSFLLLA